MAKKSNEKAELAEYLRKMILSRLPLQTRVYDALMTLIPKAVKEKKSINEFPGQLEISEMIGVAQTTVGRTLKKLTEAGKLVRVGTPNRGWYIPIELIKEHSLEGLLK